MGCIYKIIFKLLATKFKLVIPKLISEHQGAYNQGKQIQDGILIAGDLIDSRINSKKPGILVKLDIEKSFDNVICFCLDYLLKGAGFVDKQ